MPRKHFLHDPQRLVNDSLHGTSLINPGVPIDPVNRVVYVASHGIL